MNAILSLNDAVVFSLNGIEQGINSKEVIDQNNLSNLSRFIVNAQENLSLELAVKLHKAYGISYCIHNGMIENIDFGGIK